MSENVKLLMNSYTRGMAKSMDANCKIRVIKKDYTADIYSAWKDIGLELNQIMDSYSKKDSTTFYEK
ncbi:MAG: hypothetical protein COA39_012345 [Sulfurimonas sp.]|nr:hypothetical protein [Sulfurimonas sp.]